MSVEKPRIAILGMHLESNAFAPVTTEKDFGYLEGERFVWPMWLTIQVGGGPRQHHGYSGRFVGSQCATCIVWEFR